jgi:curved DNA-binding protein CbpA
VNPFAALNLPPDPALTDENVRAAWRAIATQTHPDRPDGGNPAAYAAAQAAYAQLRTGWGRSEALADLAVLPHIPPAPAPGHPWHALFAAAAVLPARIVKGRPLRIAARAAIAAAAAYAVTRLAPGTPAEPADVIGCATWWLLSSRADLAPPPGR